MSPSLHFVCVRDFLLYEASGPTDLVSATENLRMVCQIWQNKPEWNILADIRRVELRFSILDVRSFSEVLLATSLGVANRVAMLYQHREAFDHPRFLEFLTAKSNRQFKLFEDFEEAMRWLSFAQEIPTQAEQSANLRLA